MDRRKEVSPPARPTKAPPPSNFLMRRMGWAQLGDASIPTHPRRKPAVYASASIQDLAACPFMGAFLQSTHATGWRASPQSISTIKRPCLPVKPASDSAAMLVPGEHETVTKV